LNAFLNDKWQFSRLLEKLKIPQPETIILECSEQVYNIKKSFFPIIVKPLNCGGGAGIKRFDNLNDFSDYLSVKEAFNSLPLLIQKYLPGKDLHAFIYAVNGKLKARSICYNGRGRREFIDNDEIVDSCKKIVADTNYNGIGLIDIRYDTQKDKYYFIEINTRFPGSLQYHYYAGINYVKFSIDSAMKHNRLHDFISTHNKKLFYRPLELFLSKLNLFVYRRNNQKNAKSKSLFTPFLWLSIKHYQLFL
jgi:glutathione synthase/RimK-type ligase-like ATP-grasp enzyme